MTAIAKTSTQKKRGRGRKDKRGRGQPTKLTRVTRDAIVEKIRDGNFARVAAGAVGIREETFYNWMKWGKAGKAPVYVDFFKAAARARDEAETLWVGRLVEAHETGKSPAPAIEWLKRARGERWNAGPDSVVNVGVVVQAEKETLVQTIHTTMVAVGDEWHEELAAKAAAVRATMNGSTTPEVAALLAAIETHGPAQMPEEVVRRIAAGLDQDEGGTVIDVTKEQ